MARLLQCATSSYDSTMKLPAAKAAAAATSSSSAKSQQQQQQQPLSWMWQSFSATLLYACYFSTLPKPVLEQQHQQIAQTDQAVARIVVVLGVTALAAAASAAAMAMMMPTLPLAFVNACKRVWRIFCSSAQLVAGYSLFILMCQSPPPSSHKSSSRGDANYYHFSLLSLVEHSYTLPLLGACRILGPQLIAVRGFCQALDALLGYVLGPACCILVLLVFPSQQQQDQSSSLQLSTLQSWILFLIFLAVHLFGSSSSRGISSIGQPKVATTIVIFARGTLMAGGVCSLLLQRHFSPENDLKSDYYFFRAFFATSSSSRYVVKSLLLIWLGLLSSRWFAELCGEIFFYGDDGTEATGSKRRIAVVTMKEDVDDACSSLAVAAILAGAYAISSRPLPEFAHPSDQQQQQQQHCLSMLSVLALLACLVAGVHVVHTVVKQMVLLSSMPYSAAKPPPGMDDGRSSSSSRSKFE